MIKIFFRLTVYDTDSDNKQDAIRYYTYYGEKSAIYYLWVQLTRHLHKKHVEVFSLAGKRLDLRKGLSEFSDDTL